MTLLTYGHERGDTLGRVGLGFRLATFIPFIPLMPYWAAKLAVKN